MVRAEELKRKASSALSNLSPEVRKALEAQLAPKTDNLVTDNILSVEDMNGRGVA
jgi:hypothetical protein